MTLILFCCILQQKTGPSDVLDGDLKRVRDRRVLKTASWGEEQRQKRQQSSRAAGHNNHLLVDSHLTAWILLWTKTNLPFQHQHFLVKTFKGKATIPQICGRMPWRKDGHNAMAPEKFEEATPRSKLVKARRLGTDWGPFWYWCWPHSPHPVNLPMPKNFKPWFQRYCRMISKLHN